MNIVSMQTTLPRVIYPSKKLNLKSTLRKTLEIYHILIAEDVYRLERKYLEIIENYIIYSTIDIAIKKNMENFNYTKNYMHAINKILKDKGWIVSPKRGQYELNENLKLIQKAYRNKTLTLKIYDGENV